jgi:hypothetical protein
VDNSKTCVFIDAQRVDFLGIDGPALRVCMVEQSVRLFPLRRILRIHVLGTLSKGFETLITCAERKIFVAFFTRTGRLRGQLYYPALEQTPLSHWLEHIEFDSDIHQNYQDWLLHQSLFLLSQTGFRRGCSLQGLQQASKKQEGLATEMLGVECPQAWHWLEGYLHIQVAQLLLDFGLAHPSRAKRLLQADLMPLFTLWMRNAFLIWQQRKRLPINGRTMTYFFQQHHNDLDTIGRRMLTQLASRFEAIL